MTSADIHTFIESFTYHFHSKWSETFTKPDRVLFGGSLDERQILDSRLGSNFSILGWHGRAMNMVWMVDIRQRVKAEAEENRKGELCD